MREKKQTPVRRETEKNTHQMIILKKKHKCLKTGHPTIKQFIIIFQINTCNIQYNE